MLEKNMGITTELHKLKLTKHIQRLCDGQIAYEKKMLPAVIVPTLESKEPATKLVRKKHRKKKHTHPSQRTQNLKYGWTSGHDDAANDAAHAGIARVKVQRLLHEKHADDTTRDAATLKEQELWRYAYDGTPCPGAPSANNTTAVTSDAFASAMSSVRKEVLQESGQATATLSLSPTHGTMSAAMNSSAHRFDASVPADARVKRGRDGRRFIPTNATTQDVLAVVKQAMWEAADVLWSQRSLENLQRHDSDLDSYENGIGAAADHSDSRHTEQEVPQCRMTMLFHEFVGLRNNGAHWLGSNHKLTRLKLEGGLATLLKLELAWEQFDAMFNYVDTRRSGTLSAREFAIAFGRQEDIAMYSTTITANGSNGYGSPTRRRIAAAAYSANSTANTADAVSSTEITQHELQVLKETLIGVAQTLLNLGLTLDEIWATFDRNGSGEVSVSEFTSLMKQLCGGLTKRQIYLMLSCIDVSGDRQISLQELRNFFYAAWTARLSTLKSEHIALNDQGLHREAQVKHDRASKLRDAIRLNFDRAFRDAAATNGANHLHGPFSALLQRMDLQPDNAAVAVSPTRLQCQLQWTSPSPPTHSSSKPRRRAQALKAGRNELIRCRLASAHTREPRRDDTKLSLPEPVNISALPLNTVQNEQAIVERGIWKTYAVML
jgi:EF hand/EF-hand domain pair